MDYQNFMQSVQNLDFISDDATADAAVKAVLGHLASRVDEPQAEKISHDLPEPLSLGKLRSHQARVADISVEQFIGDLCNQFKFNADQANQLVKTVFSTTKNAVDSDTLSEVQSKLPSDWTNLMQVA